MSLLSELKSARGRKSKRLGRGKGSGKGGTSTKGHKGQKARSGVKLKRGFEGGQMPLVRRLPKFGFSNHSFKKIYIPINLKQLNEFNGEVKFKDFVQKKWVKKSDLIKILAQGKLEKPLKIEAHQFSQKAKAEIEKKGGQIILIQKKGSADGG